MQVHAAWRVHFLPGVQVWKAYAAIPGNVGGPCGAVLPEVQTGKRG